MRLSLFSFSVLLVASCCASAPLERRDPSTAPSGSTPTEPRDSSPASQDSSIRKTMAPLGSNGSYWFVAAKAGEDHALILVDTGSPDTVLNAGRYRPTPASVNLNQTFALSYVSTAADGGGAQNFTGSVYEDSVCVHGIKATQQPLGVLDATSAQYPGQGIIGFVPSPNITQQPYGYFDTLCGQGKLEACTFGLALKPDNSGTLAVGYAPGTTGLGAGTPVTVGGGSSEADAGYMEPADGWVIQNASSLIKTTIDGRPMNSTTVRVFYPDSGTSVTLTTRDEARLFFQEAGMRAEELPEQGRVQGFYDCASPPQLGFQIKDQLFEFHESTIAYHTPDSDDSTWPGKRSAGAGAPTLPARFSAGPRIFDELSSFSGDMLQRSSALRQEVRRQDAQECLSSIFGDATVETRRGQVWLVGQNWLRGKYVEHNLDARTLSISPVANC